jgi:hypothetical protein
MWYLFFPYSLALIPSQKTTSESPAVLPAQPLTYLSAGRWRPTQLTFNTAIELRISLVVQSQKYILVILTILLCIDWIGGQINYYYYYRTCGRWSSLPCLSQYEAPDLGPGSLPDSLAHQLTNFAPPGPRALKSRLFLV